MKSRHLLRASALIAFFCLAGASLFGADEAVSFLKKWDVSLKSGEGAMVGNLVTIVPSSGRIIIKSADADQKTIVLGLDSGCKVMQGKMTIQPDALQRGETVVLVLDVKTKAVHGVYKFK